MLYALLKLAHLLAAVLWIGGMAFAHFFLRPSLAQLPPPARLALMREVLRRFFVAVQTAIIVLLGSGFVMIGRVSSLGVGRAGWPPDWIAMIVLGLVMVVLFGAIRIVLFPRFERQLDAGDLPAAAATLARVRALVLTNLVLGVTVIAVMVLV